jgi:hypothetical protein
LINFTNVYPAVAVAPVQVFSVFANVALSKVMNVKGVVVTESLTKISTESPVVKLLYALT